MDIIGVFVCRVGVGVGMVEFVVQLRLDNRIAMLITASGMNL